MKLAHEGILAGRQCAHADIALGTTGHDLFDFQRRGIELVAQSSNNDDNAIPLLGTVAAGQPIEAILSHDTVPVPRDLQGRGRTFALRVRGDSMIDENIQDGDIIIVASQKTAENGEVVVALIDGNYATVKKFYREPDFIRLEPANPQFKPIFVKTPERIQIQGVVRGLIRKYDQLAVK